MARFKQVVAAGIILLELGVLTAAGPAQAQRALPPEAIKALSSYSPSVRHAAILKYKPPRNWIQFYLPDDRYLIGGNIWRVVSTELDVYYHRANCPNMRRQSPNIVIGFPDSKLAEEAGYRPDATCRPQEPVVVYGPGGTRQTSNTGATPIRVTLADGTSSAMLPPDWKHTSQTNQFQGIRISADLFQPPNGRGMLSISTITVPGNRDLSRMYTAEGFRANVSNMQRGLDFLGSGTGVVNSRMSNVTTDVSKAFRNIDVKAARVGGLRGMQLKFKSGFNLPGVSARIGGVRSFAAARGSKIYSVDDYTGNARGANIIINGFQAR